MSQCGSVDKPTLFDEPWRQSSEPRRVERHPDADRNTHLQLSGVAEDASGAPDVREDFSVTDFELNRYHL